MKKYTPIILYPYIFLIGMLTLMGLLKVLDEETLNAMAGGLGISLILIALISLYTFICAILCIVYVVQLLGKKHSALEVAKINRTIKCVQIPAYIINFVVGFIGATTVFGLGFALIAVIVDFIAICMTGLFGAVTALKLHKQGGISGGGAVVCGLGSFIYCIDVLIALILPAKCKKTENI